MSMSRRISGRHRAVCRIASFGLAALVLAAPSPALARVSLGGYMSEFGSHGSGPGQLNSPSGIAVDPSDGSVYVVDFGNNRVEKFNADGVFQSQLGCASGVCPQGTGPGQFHFPEGIAVDPSDGDVYVTDAFNNRVEKFGRTGSFIWQFGSAGSGDGQFSMPIGIAVDAATGSVYVADSNNDRVEKFDTSGAFESRFGSSGTGNGQFVAPRGVAVDPADGSVYVVDYSTNRVEKFDPSGAYQSQVGCATGACSQSAAPGGLNLPTDVALDPSDGSILVADSFNIRAELFSASGSYLAQFGNSGTAPGQFSQTQAVAFDPVDGSFYVLDLSGRVEHFRWPGAYLETFGSLGTGNGQFSGAEGAAVQPGDHSVLVADSNGNRVERFTPSGGFSSQIGCATGACTAGSGNGVFHNPIELAASPSLLYVTDYYNNRVEKFDASGAFLLAIGSLGSGAGQFNQPVGVALSPGGTLYVTDFGGNRVEFFSSDVYGGQLGCGPPNACPPGSGSGQFNGPTSVAVDPTDGSVYVADYFNNRVEKFSAAGAFLATIGSAGSGAGKFNTPQRLAVDPADGSLYVADTGNNRIERFSSTGVYQSQLGVSGNGTGQFMAPRGIGVDGLDGGVYIADHTNNDVQKLGVPAAPACTGGSISTPEETLVHGTLHCSAPTGFRAFYAISLAPAHGAVVLNPYTGDLTYTPSPGFAGSDLVTFSAADPGGTTAVTVAVTVLPPPTCQSLSATTGKAKPLTVMLSCTDAAGASVIYSIVADPGHGTLTAIDQSSGKLIYTPNAGYVGADSFTYRGASANGVSAAKTVSIDVTVPPRIASTINTLWAVLGRRITALQLTATNVPGGSTITMKCKGKPRCRFKKKTIHAAKTGKVNLLKALSRRNRRFRAGETLEIRITHPGYIGKDTSFKFKKGKIPRGTVLCINPGASKPSRC
jgi:tripartite motif-containing protein 71